MLQYPYMTTNHFIPSLESHHIGACLDVTRQCKMQVQSERWNILDMCYVSDIAASMPMAFVRH